MIKQFLHTMAGMLIYSISLSQHTRTDNLSPGLALPATTTTRPAQAVPERTDNDPVILPPAGDVTGHDNGAILFKGTVKNNRLHGNWQSWYANENPCDSGRLVKGVPTSEWKHWNREGQLVSLRTYDASKLQRVKNEIRRNHPKEAVYPLTALHRKNTRHAAQYMHAGYSFDFGGRVHPASLREAVAHNITSGNKYRPLFDECLHHGLYMNWYDNGTTKDSGHYRNGLKEGIWLHRKADGSYQTGVYRHGQKNAEWKEYDAKQRLAHLHFYNRKGQLEWSKKMGR